MNKAKTEVILPFKPPVPTKEQYQYQNLVNNIASLVTNQCNLFQRQVPDSISKHHKGQKLLEDVIEALKLSV